VSVRSCSTARQTAVPVGPVTVRPSHPIQLSVRYSGVPEHCRLVATRSPTSTKQETQVSL